MNAFHISGCFTPQAEASSREARELPSINPGPARIRSKREQADIQRITRSVGMIAKPEWVTSLKIAH